MRSRRLLARLALAATALLPACGDREEAARPPDLVLVVIDTLRADAALPAEEGGWGAMPAFAALARKGTLFTQASAPAPWTVPSIVSLFTALTPEHHGVTQPREAPRIPAAIVTAAEALRDRGYDTAAFFGGPWLGPEGSVLQGFDRMGFGFSLQGTEDQVGPWARTRDRSRPFFLVLHTFDVHDPYGARNHPYPEVALVPPEEGPSPASLPDRELARAFFLDVPERLRLQRAMGPVAFHERVLRYTWSGAREDPEGPALAADLRAAYRGGVEWADGLLAQTLERLEGWGLLEDAVLAVTADHGEAFGEHGLLEHGRDLHDELVRVPLALVGRGFEAGRVVRESVGLIDLMPTLLDVAGVVPLPGADGTSFLPVLSGGEPGRVVLAEDLVNARNTGLPLDRKVLSARSERWKAILTADRASRTVSEAFHDLRADPAEATVLSVTPDLDVRFAEALRGLRARADAWVGAR